MLVVVNNHGTTLLIENLDNPKTFPVTNQEKQEENFAKALDML